MIICLPETPCSTNSLKSCNEDRQFTGQEIKHQLVEGNMEPSSAPWQGQVVIVKDEFDHHKNHVRGLPKHCRLVYRA